MQILQLDDIAIHYLDDGPAEAPAIVFANSLGTDLRLWDKIVPLVREGRRVIRFDNRGHGLTSLTRAPYEIGRLVQDAERLLDHLDVRDCVFVGLSIGGLIGQGLAAQRPDLLRALVLSNTAARIGTPQMWTERIETVTTGGIAALADAVLERWFTPAFRAGPELAAWRAMLTRTPVDGYSGCCAAIAGADFRASTAQLTLPVLAIAGAEDGATPPESVRETAALIAGARFALIEAAGHLPPVETPIEYSRIINKFIDEVQP